MSRLSRIVILVLVAASATWCVISFHSDMSQLSLTSMRHPARTLVIVAMLSLLSYALRALRWRWYLRRLGYPLTLGFSTSTYVAGFAFTLSPARIGEVMRARYYVEKGIPLEAVAAAFFVERLMDALAMLALAALILTIFPRYLNLLGVVAVLVGCTLAALAMLPWNTMAMSFTATRPVGSRVGRAIIFLTKILNDARTLLRPRVLAAGFIVGLAAWSLEGIGLSVISAMFPQAPIDSTVVIGIYGAAILIGALSLLPGGLGSTEAAIIALLTAAGHSVEDAAVIALACRLLTLWLGILLGWAALFMLRGSHPILRRGT